MLWLVVRERDDLRPCDYLGAESQKVGRSRSGRPGLAFKRLLRYGKLGRLAQSKQRLFGREIQSLAHSREDALFSESCQCLARGSGCSSFEILGSEQGVPGQLRLTQSEFGCRALWLLLRIQFAHRFIMPISVHFVPLVSTIYQTFEAI